MEKKRVLIVDDEADFTTGVSVVLESAGYETLVADNGLRALEEIDIFQPDAIILDIYMPVMDGVKVCKLVRIEKQNTMTPIIAITAFDDEAKRNEILDAGANVYLTKPIPPEQLLDQVRTLVGS